MMGVYMGVYELPPYYDMIYRNMRLSALEERGGEELKRPAPACVGLFPRIFLGAVGVGWCGRFFLVPVLVLLGCF